jgi:pimeloyl-ACP methyl ester carboxylesterase
LVHDQTSSPDPRVVCLHGLGRTPADWDGVRPELARFGEVVAPRIPSAPTQALDVVDAAITPASIVVGHSMGAVLAMRLAKTRPRALRAAILTGCFFAPARNGRTLAATAADYAAHRLAFLRASRLQRTRRADQSTVRPLVSLLRLAIVPAGLDCALASVTPSVLIVHARDDHHVPIDFAIAASRRHTDWSLEVLGQGGHHAHVTEPHLWAAAVTSWLDERPDAGA